MLEDLIKHTFCRKDKSGEFMACCEQIENLYEVGRVTAKVKWMPWDKKK